jgi:hypothetical protein
MEIEQDCRWLAGLGVLRDVQDVRAGDAADPDRSLESLAGFERRTYAAAARL